MCFTVDAGSEGEQRTYLMWDYTEEPRRCLTLTGEGKNLWFYGERQKIRKMLTTYDVYLLREFELWLCFTDGAGTEGEQRTYPKWD